MLDALGWIATGLFVSSYFFKSPDLLRRVQAIAALLWIGYGVAIGSGPVIASNVLVASIAAYSSWSRRPDPSSESSRSPAGL